MNRSDFLTQLKRALEGELSAQAVKENLDYYSEYIKEEMRNGKSEQEVIEMLGDPWAIAKTILMSAGMNGQEYSSDTADMQEKRDGYQEHKKVHVFGLDSWWKKAAAVFAVVAVIAIVISIVMGIIRLIAPIVIPVLGVLMIVNIWKKNR